ncbi:MAG: sterol-binding protein, partial [Gammaproteobacteria bacterium]|nr:sterol-binding protein [Gammaproteobacteria bacterium]
QLTSLHGKVLGIDLSGTAITLFFIPDQNGQLQVLSQYEGQPDCLISGAPLNLLRSSIANNTDSTFSGDVHIEGSAALAQEFTSILKRIDIDWEEQLSRITGDILAHQIGNNLRAGSSWLSRNLDSTGLNFQEYLQEEARVLPGALELENFYQDVDRLRDDVERLAARIQRLLQKQD